MHTIQITLNGEARTVPDGETVAGLLSSLNMNPARIAIELDRRIVKQTEWSATILHDGAQLEIVQFVGGG